MPFDLHGARKKYSDEQITTYLKEIDTHQKETANDVLTY